MMKEYLLIVGSTAAIYVFIILFLRLFGKKELAQLSVFDLVFVLLISNSVQNAMVGDNTTLWGGLTAAGTLFILNYGIKYLLYYFPKLGNIVQGKELLLVYKGKVKNDNLRKARITIEELEEAMREHGVSEIRKVDMAMLEVDGNISILSDEFKKRSIHTISRHRRPKKFQRN
jgi:uncharacterized membrane protein YcaP (DUF421 family)